MPALLRLSPGRWPDAEEGHRFRKAFQADRHPLPPLLRGLASITAGQALLIRASLFAWCQARATTLPGMMESSDSAALVLAGNPLRAWDGPPIAFLHVEKTAGTSLIHYLQERFHPTQIDPDPLRAWPPHMLTRFPPGIAEHVRRYRLVWGHYDLPSLNCLGPERFVLTPVARAEGAPEMFNNGESGFREGDLYAFCSNLSTGKVVALGNPNAKQLLGRDERTLKDSTGKVFGEELFDGMQKPEGQVTEVRYMFPKPGADKTPVPKVSLVTKASNDLGCGVGYYPK